MIEADKIAQLVATLRSRRQSDSDKISACGTLITMAIPPSCEHLVKAGVVEPLIGLLKSPALQSHAAALLTCLLCSCERVKGVAGAECRAAVIAGNAVDPLLGIVRSAEATHHARSRTQRR